MSKYVYPAVFTQEDKGMFSVNFPMLLLGFLITGISVGVGVPASWTYISERLT